MEHYKLDWHRFNLKQKMLGASPVSAEEFEKKTGAGEEKTEFGTFLESLAGKQKQAISDVEKVV